MKKIDRQVQVFFDSILLTQKISVQILEPWLVWFLCEISPEVLKIVQQQFDSDRAHFLENRRGFTGIHKYIIDDRSIYCRVYLGKFIKCSIYDGIHYKYIFFSSP